MAPALLGLLLFAAAATGVALLLLLLGVALGPRRRGAVKDMPYESGMDPLHDARRRFDVRFNLIAVTFLLFDVEVIFLYPWAVARKHPEGLAALQTDTFPSFQMLVLLEVLVFVFLLAAGLAYVWRKGLFRWR
jgi:NADH-quinone oxidoreductase subunit A